MLAKYQGPSRRLLIVLPFTIWVCCGGDGEPENYCPVGYAGLECTDCASDYHHDNAPNSTSCISNYDVNSCGVNGVNCDDMNPVNSAATCDGVSCSFDCLPGFHIGLADHVGQCILDSICDNSAFLDDKRDRIQAWMTTLTDGIDEYPLNITLPEDTNGTLGLELNSNAFPILVGDKGVFAAGATLGEGRIVSFSGQDFLGSQTRSTLLGLDGMHQLLRNAVRWVNDADSEQSVRILVDSQAIADVLEVGENADVSVTPKLLQSGLWQTRDWTAGSLQDVDVAIVQVNEWGTLRVGPTEIGALREFVQNGGGLLIAGSALHWRWWLSDSAEDFIGNLIVAGSGINWNADSVRDLSSGAVGYDPLASPDALWCAYLKGESLDSSHLARLAPIFVAAQRDGYDRDVDRGLMRLIAETPLLPANAHSAQARLSAEVAASLGAHRWPAAHPWASTFPGLPSVDGSTNGSMVVDLSTPGVHPLGFYAPPGELVTISLPLASRDGALKVRIGELYDDLRSLSHISVWYRAPILVRDFVVDSEHIQVVNPFGGAIYLLVESPGRGDINVEVQGAIPMAVHTKGESSNDTWQEALRGGAPQAILQEHGHVRMVVEAEAAQAVRDPDDVIEFWSRFYQHHADLAQEPDPRRFESHWIFDVQVGWGYANTTGDRIAYPKLSETWALRTQVGNEDWWLFGHELGHQFQTADWSGGDVTEVCVNLFTMYTLNDYIHRGGEFETRGFSQNDIGDAELVDYRWDTSDLFGKLQLYRQLVLEFGWTAYKKTFASYYDANYPRFDFGSFMDGFAIRFSSIVERDLSSFFEHWNYPLSSGAAARIRQSGFEPWMPTGWSL